MSDDHKVESQIPVPYWLGQIAVAKRRENDYRKDGENVMAIYAGEKTETTPFNILFSNVETLLPALFSQKPRPVVERRFKDDDPMGKAAAIAGQRMLEYLCDTNVEGYETFEDSMTAATLDALLPGRGVTSITYDANVIEPGIDSDSAPVVEWEQVCTESRSWDCVIFGFAKKWSQVPWIAYETYLDKREAERMFGDLAAKLKYTDDENGDDDEGGTGTGGRDDADGTGRKTSLVYQIWDRAGGKKIRYVAPDYADGYLKVDEDPLGLTGFFNCPRPLQFVEKNDMKPVAMYRLYENQAEELNSLTRRIKKVVAAIKVRGAYDGSLGDEMEKIFKEDDNGLVPTDKGGSLAIEGGFDKAIWLIPVEKLVIVLQQLILAREQAKRVIYEITGIADILRGNSMASETLGAQKIKEAWGTLRLKRLQKMVQRYARDSLRIMLEIAANKLSERTWARATGLPFATSEQKAQAQMIVQASAAMGQQPDEKTMAVLNAPGWSDVLKLLKDDVQRSYRIDIETNSTIDTEATEDQQNISQVMQAIAQFMHGFGPLVESGVMSFEVAKEMLLTIVRRFRFGTEVEDALKSMAAPKPKDDGKGAEAAAKQAEAQANLQARAAELQQQGQIELAKHQREIQSEQNRQQEAAAAMTMERDLKLAQIAADRDAKIAQANAEKAIAQMKAKIEQQTELQKAQIQAQAQMQIATMQAQCSKQDGENLDNQDSTDPALVAVIDGLRTTIETVSRPKTKMFIHDPDTGRPIGMTEQ